jgi:serine O-acetyltransferase
MSWAQVVEEAKRIAEKDEFMADIMKRGITDHCSFPSALIPMLADVFATERIPAHRWSELFSSAYQKDVVYEPNMESLEVMGLLDLVAILERDPACDGLVAPFLYFKGYRALQTHRIAHVLWRSGRKDAAIAVQSRCSDLFSVDIHPAAVIGTTRATYEAILSDCGYRKCISAGAGLMIDHGTGIVIGQTTVVGRSCSFLHGVTLGSTGKDKGDRHPKVGNDVLIGCNATILGNIRIGNCCKIGSGSLVLKPLPNGVTAVGNPAQIVGRSLCSSAAAGMDTGLVNVVNSKGLKFSETYSLWPDGEVDMFYI